MTLTSFSFFCFLAVVFLTYYLCPGRFRHILLLIASLCFYIFAAVPYTICYLAVSIITVYAAALTIQMSAPKKARIVLIITIIINIGLLATLKYLNFFIFNINGVLSLFNSNNSINTVNLVSSLGISFYTLQILSYLIDVYWKTVEPQKNFFKFSLFACYFPQLFSGPICRYNQVEKELYSYHPLEFKNLTFGLQRLLYGLFKKLVISERLGILVTTVYADPAAYPGAYIWFATFGFALQLYTDFSGCMDIILGASECLGIKLPENFRTPFFAKTIQEFWQRWHITLGTWLKDYIMYPILKSEPWIKLGDFCKKKFGKKKGRKIPTYLGMLVLWLAMGLWHGNSWKYIVGEGLLFWIFIVAGQLLKPYFEKMNFLHINTESIGFHIFQSIRTFLLFSAGMLFFRAASLRTSFTLIGKAFTTFNPQIIFNGSLLKLGLSTQDFIVCMISLIMLLIISLLSEKYDLREAISRKSLPVRWLIWYLLIFIIIIFGCYGSGYDASAFIYAQF